ncbi:MAG: CaiB/BaiF CoA-transferase family protein [Proteobacteria bacterium]|nr:CaiB/BaiF CoA-transferase family protein [Pseudomonadota bacterium]MDA1057275.1 CaiB/BaiF CoA-transferase family protein [Pseudomonadota bacterium]
MVFAPLDGVLVVSLEQAVAAPFCSSRLADAGARVIKVERAEGDFARAYDTAVNGLSAYFVWLSRGKESVIANIKNADDNAMLHRMLAKADVFIQNLAPGAAARAGLGSDDLRTKYPRLITCDISGYGENGPYRDMKAYDFLIQCETGLAAITGGPEEPARVGVSLCDIAAGMYAVQGITQAILQREKTGRGTGLQVSLFDALSDWMTVPLLLQEHTGKPPARVGLNHPGIAPYGAYNTKDDKPVAISIQNQREWANLCAEVLGNPSLTTKPEFATNVDRVAHRAQLDAVVSTVFAQHTRDDISRKLEAAQIAYGAVNTVEDFSHHPQLRRMTVGSVAGDIDLVASPIRLSDQPLPAKPIPSLGAHNAALRAEFAP